MPQRSRTTPAVESEAPAESAPPGSEMSTSWKRVTGPVEVPSKPAKASVIRSEVTLACVSQPVAGRSRVATGCGRAGSRTSKLATRTASAKGATVEAARGGAAPPPTEIPPPKLRETT